MPKVISDHEREQTRNAIVNSAMQLIRTQKGIKHITVDEIIKPVGVGKSAFYSHFGSKEECIYEAVENSRIDLLNQFDKIMLTKQSKEKKVVRFLREVYLKEGNISNYISSNDMVVLLRKLPPSYSEREEKMSMNIFSNMMNRLNLGMVQTETVTVLLDCIDHIVAYADISERVMKAALDTMIVAITDYIEKNSK